MKNVFVWELREIVILLFPGKKLKSIVDSPLTWNTWPFGVEGGAEVSLTLIQQNGKERFF